METSPSNIHLGKWCFCPLLETILTKLLHQHTGIQKSWSLFYYKHNSHIWIMLLSFVMRHFKKLLNWNLDSKYRNFYQWKTLDLYFRATFDIPQVQQDDEEAGVLLVCSLWRQCTDRWQQGGLLCPRTGSVLQQTVVRSSTLCHVVLYGKLHEVNWMY